MEKPKKRIRNVNFSQEETEKLVALVVLKKHIVENKKSDAETWQEKEKAWNAIETEFNSTGAGAFRSAKHLKLKYEALKRDIRKKCHNICAEGYNSGARTSEVAALNPIERKVKELILLSFEGSESLSDFDPLEVGLNEEPNSGPANNITVSVKMEESYSDTDSMEYSNNMTYEQHVEEKIPIKRPLSQSDSMPNNFKQMDQDVPEMYEPKQKRPYEQSEETKLDVIELQRMAIEKELEERNLKIQLLKVELGHKKQMFALELDHKKKMYALEEQQRKVMFEMEKTQILYSENIIRK